MGYWDYTRNISFRRASTQVRPFLMSATVESDTPLLRAISSYVPVARLILRAVSLMSFRFPVW